MIDIHSHVLPKADHGSYSIEDSLKQLKTAAKCGVKTIVATPHFYAFNDNIDNFLVRRDKSFYSLSLANDTGITILKGAEVRLVSGLSTFSGIRKLAIENTDYILIEMPSGVWTNMLINEIVLLQALGLNLIIAHIERYSIKQMQNLLKFDVLTQINAYSLFNPIQNIKIRKYMHKGIIDFIASDSHIYNYFLAYSSLKRSQNIIGSSFNSYMENAKTMLSL